MKIVIASGYFLTYHAGHEEYLRKAKRLGEKLIVLINNDAQQKLKYGKVIVPFKQRKSVIESIKYVDFAFSTTEDWTQDLIYSLEQWSKILKGNEIIFAKGGDRKITEIPESKICVKLKIKIVDSLGEKIQSSSTLLNLEKNEKNH